jgi:hypothetical protein
MYSLSLTISSLKKSSLDSSLSPGHDLPLIHLVCVRSRASISSSFSPLSFLTPTPLHLPSPLYLDSPLQQNNITDHHRDFTHSTRTHDPQNEVVIFSFIFLKKTQTNVNKHSVPRIHSVDVRFLDVVTVEVHFYLTPNCTVEVHNSLDLTSLRCINPVLDRLHLWDCENFIFCRIIGKPFFVVSGVGKVCTT